MLRLRRSNRAAAVFGFLLFDRFSDGIGVNLDNSAVGFFHLDLTVIIDFQLFAAAINDIAGRIDRKILMLFFSIIPNMSGLRSALSRWCFSATASL